MAALALKGRRRRAARVRHALGFTMIEVLVSMALTAIATTGLLAIFMSQTRASGFSRHMSEATVLAQDQMEALRASTTLGTGTATGLTERGASGGIFDRSYEVVSGIGFDEMTVTVSWTEDETVRSVRLRSRRNQ